MKKELKVKLIHENAKLPEKKSEHAAAFDLYALEDTELYPFQVTKVRTGVSVEVPEGFKGEVYTRSGYGAKGIFVANQPGKIDSDYRGEIFVLLLYTPEDFCGMWCDLINNLIEFAKNGASHVACINLASAIQKNRFETYKIKAGDRIAQFEIQEVVDTVLFTASVLSKTERGEGGLGSTGR